MSSKKVLYIALSSLVLLAGYLYIGEIKDSTQLPGIGKLIIHGSLPQSITRDYTTSKLSYINRFGDLIILDIDTEIRIRGNSSTLYPKKSFGLKFPSKITLEGMPHSKNWILIPNYLDMTFLRNKLSYDLFNSFDINNKAALTKFVEIYFEDDYHGLYVLTQRLDAEMLRLSETGLLFKDPPLNFPSSDHDKNLKTHQEYFRKTAQYKAFSMASRAKMNRRAYYNQRYPKFEKADHTKEIHKLTDLLFETSDSLFCDSAYGINHYFDLTNIMDWHLLLLFSNNYDGIKKNYYLYKEDKNGLFKISPWDYDHGYGRDSDGEPHPDLIIDFNRLKIFERLVQPNACDYNKQLRDRYKLLKEKGVFENKAIQKLINQYQSLIEPYLIKNHERWPLNDHKYLGVTTYEDELKLLKNWVEQRFDIIETYLDSIQVNSGHLR